MSIRIRPRGESRNCAKCGVTFRPLIESLRLGGGRFCSKRCGYAAVTKHGATAGTSGWTPEYRAWHHIKVRCLNVNSQDYAAYGGRGITVCDKWANSFEAFLQDMGIKPSCRHSIDRINNNGNYEPGNCRWATPKEQANNRRVPVRKRVTAVAA